MVIKLALKNYRCFGGHQPVELVIQDGFTAIVGTNNIGKSALLRFLYEMRPFFDALAPDANLQHFLAGQKSIVGWKGIPADNDDYFCDENQRQIELHVELSDFGDFVKDPKFSPINRLDFQCERGTGKWSITSIASPGGGSYNPGPYLTVETGIYLRSSTGNVLGELSGWSEASIRLGSTVYVGPFRNALNAESRSQYFDVAVGLDVIETCTE